MNIYVCKVCGHIEFNNSPNRCPICSALKNEFENNNNIFIDSEKRSKESSIKHVPFIKFVEKNGLNQNNKYTNVLVRIGKKLHPMEEKHYIGFIDCYLDDKYISRIMFTPFMKPSGIFHLTRTGSKITIVESCNIHGHWMTEANL